MFVFEFPEITQQVNMLEAFSTCFTKQTIYSTLFQLCLPKGQYTKSFVNFVYQTVNILKACSTLFTKTK